MGLSNFKADKDKVEQGIRVPIDEETGCYVRIKRANNDAYNGELIRLMRGHGRRHQQIMAQLRGGNEKNDSTLQAAMKTAASKHILVGWEKLIDDAGDFGDQGKELSYTAKLALELFDHPSYADFYEFVMAVANDADMFREEEVAGDSGNS